MKVLLVHGVGRPCGRSVDDRRDTAAAIAADWVGAIGSGGSRYDRSRLLELTEVVLYRDWGWLPDDQSQGDGQEPTGFQEALAHAILVAASSSQDPELRVAAQQELSRLDGVDGPDNQGLRKATIGAVEALSRIPVLGHGGMRAASGLQRSWLWQVDHFVNDLHGSKDAVLARFSDQIVDPDEPLAVIAHSLGSIVAYEAIHQFSANVALFITIGSPLGIRNVIYDRLIPKGILPPSVGSWVNFAAKHDPIVLEPHLGPLFGPQGRLIDVEVDNGGVIRSHLAVNYLAQPKVQSAIWGAISG